MKIRKICLFLILLLFVGFGIGYIGLKAEASNDVPSEELTSKSISASENQASIFSFTKISETECDVRLVDKKVEKAIIPDEAEIDGKKYSVTVVAVNGFSSATNLNLVRIPKSVKTIGANAFINCKALNSLTLPAVETIGANAFAMTNLDYLIIPKTVTSVASTILRGSNTQVYVRSALEEGMTTPEGWVSNWNGSNMNQSVEFDSSFVPEIKYEFVSSEIEAFDLGNDNVDLRVGGYYVTSYQEYSSIDPLEYEELYIPATYTGEDGIEYPIIGIDSFAFLNNYVDKITIGYAEEPIKLASESFYGLEGSVVTFNREVELLSEDWDGSEIISESVFACSTVSTIILPNNLQVIGNNMFDGCENLRDIHFIKPNGNLSSLAESNINISLISTNKVELPNTVIFIGNNAFALTFNIKELHIPNSVEEVGLNIVNGWNYELYSQVVYVDFEQDDPIFSKWNETWANSDVKIVYKISDNSYSITYDIDSLYHSNPTSYVSSEGLILKDAIREGYTFFGWYTDSNYKNRIENIEIGTVGDITLYGYLKANEYTITYNKNKPSSASFEISGEMEKSDHIYGLSSNLSKNIFELQGWIFTGWNTKADGSGTSYKDEEKILSLISTQNGNLTLYAQWTTKEYSILYENNKPGNATTVLIGYSIKVTYRFEEEFNLKKFDGTLEGWTFVGWNTEKYGTGTFYSDEQLVKNITTKTEITLYAQWTANTYTVVYNSNKPSKATYDVIGEMVDSEHVFDTNSFLRGVTLFLKGWIFVGWNTEADGSGVLYLDGATIRTLIPTGVITLYAQWVPIQYYIEFDGNKPNEATSILVGNKVYSWHNYEEKFNLDELGFSLEGWHFTGWNTKADGSGTSYSNGQSVKNLTSNDSITLYAQWEANAYTVIYNSNKPSNASSNVAGSMLDSTFTYDISSNLRTNTYTLTGWEFKCWKDESGTTYTDGQSVKNLTSNDSITLYAQWIPNTYTVIYNSNKPSNASSNVAGSMLDSTFTYDISSNLRTNTYTLTGWAFTGWNTKADGSGTTYTDGQSVKNLTSNDSITLYAQWIPNTYTVIYNSNKPSNASSNVAGSMLDSTFTYDISSNLRTNTYTLTGWKFKGWKDESGTTYTDGQSVKNLTSNDSITLYAQWIPNTYTVIYNSNKPSNASSNVAGSMLDSTFTYDISSNLRTNTYTLTGWEFKGWKDESGTSYTDGQSVKNLTSNDSITLYAQWEAKTYNVIYHPNYPECHSGLTNSLSSTTVTYDTWCRLNDAYTLVSWEMKYWTMYETDTGPKYYPADLVNKLLPLGNGSVINLYAQWEEKRLEDSVNGIYHEIATENQFNSLRDLAVDSSYRFRLMRDINLYDWEPIFEFNCLLDLNGYTIKYSNINVEQGNDFGFVIYNEGTIRNGYFTPRIRIQGGSKQIVYYNTIGGVASDNYGLIEYIIVNSYFGINNGYMNNNNNNILDIDAASPYNIVGGIVGSNAGTIRYCENYASIGGCDYIGGITGNYNSEQASVYRCINGGNLWYRSIIKGYKFVGGIVGMCQDSYATYNENYGKITFAYSDVTDPKDYVFMANIVGWAQTRAFISNNVCYGTIVISNNVAERNDIQAQIIKTNGDPIGAQSDEYYIKDTSEGNNCISLGTLITLADGSLVPVESLTGSESLLVWNMLTGQFDEAPILFIDKDGEELYNVINLNFSDGSIVKVIGEHGFWDITLNQYVYLKDDAEKYVGHYFAKEEVDEEGNINLLTIELISVEITEELTIPFSPVTVAHLCYFVNGMLSMPGGIEGLFNIFEVNSETMTYDQEAMEKDIELYGLYTYEEFSQLVDVPQEMFEAVNGQYLKVAIGKGLITTEELQDLVNRYILFFE